MRHTLPRSLVLVVAVVGLACIAAASGCSSEAPKGGDLNKINWVLTQYSDGGTLKDAPQGANGSAWFADDEVTGRVVNNYQGTFVAGPKGGVTAVGPFDVTKMAGPPDLMAVETVYLADLEKTTSYHSDGKTLTLYGDGDEKLVVYRATEGTVVGNWRVTAYDNGKQAVVSVISATTVTAAFDKDGRVSGEGGINTYSASYTLPGGDGILVENISAAQMSGPQEVMDQQLAYLTALESAKTYMVSGKSLELRAADGAIAVQMESAD
jgi:heat shock protein HslJ